MGTITYRGKDITFNFGVDGAEAAVKTESVSLTFERDPDEQMVLGDDEVWDVIPKSKKVAVTVTKPFTGDRGFMEKANADDLEAYSCQVIYKGETVIDLSGIRVVNWNSTPTAADKVMESFDLVGGRDQSAVI